MKKIIIIALAVLLCGTAYASKLEVSGSARYRGTIISDYNKTTDNMESKAYYDWDMNIFPKFVVDENNYAMCKFSIRDMTAGKAQSDGENDSDTYYENKLDGSQDDNIAVERAFLSTKIGPTQLSVGLMDGGAWATTFGDSVDGEWRVKAITTTPVGALVVVLRKVLETESVEGNSDDNDVYYLGFITKAGPLNIKPLLVYANYNTVVKASKEDAFGNDLTNSVVAATADKMEKTAFLLGLDGKFGNINVEFEFGYENVKFDNMTRTAAYGGAAVDEDYSLMGFLLDVSMASGDNTYGFILGYGGTDESKTGTEHGYSYGDERAYTLLLDDELEYGNTEKAGLGGFTVLALYASMPVMENLTVTPSIAYCMSNYEDDSDFIIESATEIDLSLKYKINDAVSYNVGLAYVTGISAFDGNEDPDDMWMARHNLAISF